MRMDNVILPTPQLAQNGQDLTQKEQRQQQTEIRSSLQVTHDRAGGSKRRPFFDGAILKPSDLNPFKTFSFGAVRRKGRKNSHIKFIRKAVREIENKSRLSISGPSRKR